MVELYTKPACGQCDSTKQMFKNLGIEYSEIDITKDKEALKKIKSLGYLSAPVVVTETDSWAGHKRDKIEAIAPVDNSVFDDIFA